LTTTDTTTGWPRRTAVPYRTVAGARTALIRAIGAAIALAAYPIPPSRPVIVALRRAQRPVWAPECESWADRPLFAGDRALRRSSIAPGSRGSGGVAQTERRRSPHPESSGRQVAGDDAQRRQHRGPEPSLTAGTDQVLAEVVGVGVLRSLHPDARCRCPRRPRRWPGRDPLQRPPRAGRRWCAQPGAGLGSGGFGRACRRAVGPQLCAGRSLLPRTPSWPRAEMRVGVAVTRPSSFYIIDLVP
jgi:hypothetical protein